MPRIENVLILATKTKNLKIAATCLIPENSDISPPVIVMGHGFGAVKAAGLFPFAERFVQAGYAAVMFDYLYFGESDGTPVNKLSISRELQDYRDVISWAREQSGKWDTSRVIAWGTSFGGMHITALMAEDHDLVAGIMQGACVDGFAAATKNPILKTLRQLPLSLCDWVLSLFSSTRAIYVKLVGNKENSLTTAMMSGSEAMEGWQRLTKSLDSEFMNKVTARTILKIPFSRPIKQIHRSTKPLLVILTTWDHQGPLHKAEDAVRLAPHAQGFRVPGGHFDLYEGGVAYEQNITRQLEFLQEVSGNSRMNPSKC
ncbi:Alpha/Beta hydrolase protein [Talaromyces proteolyticus]|uniref:Alpha/Beta hydrolase protein n=1 Tax=Talaromyces proteolyticus TaxID=1131652 RepID=A0AAD4KW32_9EURO|nr:Alpha/Beta hydrolase protein [Talaromyces proteolyticus]KAH8697971.1 Alpha/Beta hydrolase protein [Talaromyces proteolyticus]